MTCATAVKSRPYKADEFITRVCAQWAWKTRPGLQGPEGETARQQIARLLRMSAPAPPTLPIRQALLRNEPLTRLSQRLQESRQRFDAIAGLVPLPMRSQVRPGPVDAEGWALLAANGAVAAKLRHIVPVLQDELQSRGWPALAIRVRVVAAD